MESTIQHLLETTRQIAYSLPSNKRQCGLLHVFLKLTVHCGVIPDLCPRCDWEGVISCTDSSVAIYLNALCSDVAVAEVSYPQLDGKGSLFSLSVLSKMLVQLCMADKLAYGSVQGQMQLTECRGLQQQASFGKQPGKSKE